MGRRLAVWITARALRKGIPDEVVQEIAARRFAHRDAEWRAALLNTARARNRDRLLRKISA